MRRMIRISPAALMMGCWLAAAPAFGQEGGTWTERVLVAVDVPFDTLHAGFSESLSFADTIRRTELGHFTADYPVRRGPLIAAGAALRVSPRLGVGATVTYLKRTQSGAFAL